MPKGKGQGWEEKIQHTVFEKWLTDKTAFWREFPIATNELKQGRKAKVSADFIVDRGDYYELIECKECNSPTCDIGPALGQALVYRELIKKTRGYPGDKEKPIKLSLCFVDGFASQYCQWTSAYDALLAELAKSIREELTIYLVAPKESEFAAEKYLWDDKNFCVVQPVKTFK